MVTKRLLVVEDDPGLLQAVAVCLRVEGYEVTTARNGMEAMTRLAEGLPDLVVSDIHMPKMDGYAFARQLRASHRTALIPVIFLTSKTETSDRIEGFQAGVDAYLAKPFEPDELVAVVSGILSRVRRTHAEIVRMVGETNTEEHAKFRDEEFTEAEDRIAEAVARGLTNKEIAAESGISTRTVENHISHILAKKNFGNRVEIARYVLGKTGASER